MLKSKFQTTPIAVVALFGSLFSSATALARAGGAGGGSNGGGGGFGGGGFGGGNGGGGDIFVYLLFQLPWPITLIIVVCVVIFIVKARGRTKSDVSQTNWAQESAPIERQEQIVKYLAIAPEKQGLISPAELPILENKVMTAFNTIQGAWSAKQVNKMRRFVSDGVYQRFNAQFTMMNLLGQTDIMQNVRVDRLAILKVERAGIYDVIDIAIEAYAEDQFVCEKYPELDSPGGGEEFIEAWSFIRRSDCKPGKDIYHSELCPACSAPLTDKLVETARCQYCGAHLNNGEFDWVLAEITQIDDYKADHFGDATKPTQATIDRVRALFADFAPTTLEDRACNAFMQILIATARKDVAPLKRFSTDQAQQIFTDSIAKSDYVYDRLFVNVVKLVGLAIDGDLVRATVGVRYSYRRVQMAETGIDLLDGDVRTDRRYVVLVRRVGGQSAKGSIFANCCPSCGANQKDTLASKCEYCGAIMNDPVHDWVVESMHN